jgi:peptidoglycan/xylan/chitin deacetylase (PgdA/CDA1 family)
MPQISPDFRCLYIFLHRQPLPLPHKSRAMTMKPLFYASLILLSYACGGASDKSASTDVKSTASDTTVPASKASTEAQAPAGPKGKAANAAGVIARKSIPILCYHQIRDWKPTDSKMAKDYIMPIADFKDELKALHDSGYHTVLPDQLYDYLVYGSPLPSKPVMLTYDDTDEDQFTVARPEMDKYGYKGVFFIMTVSIGKNHYMSRAQIRQLADEGHVIGSHTWDHKNVKKYEAADYVTQIEKPTKLLQEITGKKMDYFAYPFGLWRPEAIPHLKQAGFKAAFQLYAPNDPNDPLYTIRRIIVAGGMSGKRMLEVMNKMFK